MNVYEMIVENKGPGFWVWRTTWGKTIARIVGNAPLEGKPPYFNNPKVIIDVYSLDGSLKGELSEMSAPGTYKTWRWIEAPEWADHIELRSLEDPKILTALG